MKKKFLISFKINYKLIIFIGIFIILGFVLSPEKILSPTKNLFFKVLKPFSIISNYSADKVALFFQNIINLQNLSHENQKLLKENLEYQSQLAIIKEVQHENEILKQEMGFLNTKGDLKLMPANIIGRSLTGYLKNLIIDRGAKDGISENQGVFSQGFLVGTVRNVYQDSSEIILITDNNSLVPVVLQDSRGTGLLRGGLAGITVEDIPLNIPIKKGEQVVTSGLGGDIPAGMMVGKVDEVVSKEGEIFQKVSVTSPIKIYYLEFVFVAL